VAQTNDLCKALEASQPPTGSDGPAALAAHQQAALETILCGTCSLCGARKEISEFQMLRVCLKDCASIDSTAPAHEPAAAPPAHDAGGAQPEPRKAFQPGRADG